MKEDLLYKDEIKADLVKESVLVEGPILAGLCQGHVFEYAQPRLFGRRLHSSTGCDRPFQLFGRPVRLGRQQRRLVRRPLGGRTVVVGQALARDHDGLRGVVVGGLREKLPELGKQVLLVLEQPGYLGIHLHKNSKGVNNGRTSC